MRSRYSAFVVSDIDYLLHSWAPETRPARLELDSERTWTGLTINSTNGGGALAKKGTVDFTAAFTGPGGAGVQHENSSFRRHEGRWVYVS